MTSVPEYYFDFFIAHSSSDSQIAEQLYELLEPECRVFLDTQNMLFGEDWDTRLSKAQKESLATLVLLNDDTDKSYYQREEIANAINFARENENSHVVIPVYLKNKLENIPYGLRLKHSYIPEGNLDLHDLSKQLLLFLKKKKMEIANGLNPKNEFRPLKKADNSPILFSSIRISPTYKHWVSREVNAYKKFKVFFPDRFKDWKWNMAFDKIMEGPTHADPIFDITIVNTSKEPQVLDSIGIYIEKVGHESYIGAALPEVLTIKKAKRYIIEIPDLYREIPEKYLEMRSWQYKIDRIIKTELEDPLYMEPNAPFRFELLLKSFTQNTPRFSLVSFLSTTNGINIKSEKIFLCRS